MFHTFTVWWRDVRYRCGMKGLFLLVSVMINCDKGAAPSCKDAIEKVAKVAALDGVGVTMAIGTCEQKQWTVEARQCVAAATSDDALVACNTKHGIDGPSSFEIALAKFVVFKNEMCLCQDTTCAQRVSEEMTAWSQAQTKVQQTGSPKATDEQSKRATALGEDMGKCMQRAMAAGPTGSGKMPF